MTRLPACRPEEVIKALEQAGFQRTRVKGSHVRMRHADGRAVTVAQHKGQDVGKGLLRKILRDAEMTSEEFMDFLK